MSRIQETNEAYHTGAGVASLSPAFSTDVTAGNTIVVFARSAFTGAPATTVTDSLGTTYTLGVEAVGSDPFVFAFSGMALASGPCTITVNFGPGDALACWAFGIEYSDVGDLIDAGASRTIVGTDIQSGTDLVTPGPALIVAAASITGLSGPSTFTAGTDFTLINGAIGPGGGNDFGGVEEWFAPSALSGTVLHITTSTAGTPGFVWLAFSLEPPTKVGSFFFGAHGRVRSTRTVLVSCVAGEGSPKIVNKPGGMTVDGYLDVTGNLTVGGTLSATFAVADDSITNAKLANMAQATVKGRAAGAGTGDPVDLAADQLSTLLDAATDPFVRTSASGGGGGGGDVLYPDITVPVLADFTWVNQGTATVSDATGSLIMTSPTGSYNWRLLMMSAPATPYTATALVRLQGRPAAYHRFGLAWRDSAGGNLVNCHYRIDASSQSFEGHRASVSAYNSNEFSNTGFPLGAMPVLWMRLSDDGTNRKFFVSSNGVNWIELSSVARTTFITPNQIGWGVIQDGAGFSSWMELLSWEIA